MAANLPQSYNSQARYIAVASQNRRTVTGHAGRCRRFKLFELGAPQQVGELELAPEAVLHEAALGPEHPLGQAVALIAASMGDGVRRRLAQFGIESYLTEEADPARAVAQYLAGHASAPTRPTDCHCDHGAGHGALTPSQGD